MAVIDRNDGIVHALHGSTFTSFVAPSRGSEQLCGWQLDVPASTNGVEHTVTHEEVLLVLAGELTVWVDGARSPAVSGDVVHVPAGARFRVDTGTAPARAWAVTTVGLEAITSDGARISPPWTR